MTEHSVNHRRGLAANNGAFVAKLALGRVVATQAALDRLMELAIDPQSLLMRHATGDWSEMEAEDRKANAQATADGLRVFSAYRINENERVWVITEANRSTTTVLLPHEY